MYALVIGRAYPDEKTGMMGIFEFEQAVALKKHCLKTVYAFCDTRSVKSLRKYNYVNFISNDVPVYGYHFPIGGIPRKIFDWLKEMYSRRILNDILKEHGVPEIIHIHFPLINLNHEIWHFLKSIGKPIIVTEHWTKVQSKVLEPYRIDLLKKIVNEANEFICVGEPLKRSVIELTGTDREIKVIPNMVKPDFYYEEQRNSKETFDFVTVGRLVEVKRFGFTIEGFAKAFKDNHNVRLHVIGDGPLYNELQQKIIELDMEDRIKMYGFLARDKTAELVRKCDVLVSASVLETFGVPFIEAMSCGKPVIGIKNGPIDNYINESNGLLFDQDNMESFINTLRIIYRNRKSYNEKVISEQAQSLFSEKAVATQLFNIFKYHLK